MPEISRRKFIQLSVLSSAVAASGCDTHNGSRYAPGVYAAEVSGTYGGYSNRLFPYVNQPSGLVDGVPQYFASVCRMCPAGCGIYVRTMSGRAVQIQGNPLHPVSGGAICARGVGALQYLYNPDRLRFPRTRPTRSGEFGEPGWPAAITQATQGLSASRGKVAVLVDEIALGRSPSIYGMVSAFAKSVGGTVYSYSLHDDTVWRAAAKSVYGKDQLPDYQIDQADCILSFSGDFMEALPSPVLYSRQFGDFRQGPRRAARGNHGTFVYIGPRMSQTAAKADLWLPCNPGTEAVIAEGIAGYLTGGSLAAASAASGIPEAQLVQAATAFKAAGNRAVAIPGSAMLSSANASAAIATVERLNLAVGSKCVGFGTSLFPANTYEGAQVGYAGMQRLIGQMNSGGISALVILGQPNPVFTLPAADGFAQAMSKVPFVLAITPFEDETTTQADVLLPSRTFLEEWGDNVPSVTPAGSDLATLQQPIIDPGFIGGQGSATDVFDPRVPWMDTLPLGEILIELAGSLGTPMKATSTLSAVRQTWSKVGDAAPAEPDPNNDSKWVAAVALGGKWNAAAATTAGAAGGAGGAGATGGAGAAGAAAPPPAPAGTLALLPYPSTYWTDGRGANVPWHQEIANPMSMAVWNSWAEINIATAEQHGIRTGDLIKLESPYGSIEALAQPSWGIHPDAIAIPIGQGHTHYGRYADGRGCNPLAILAPTSDSATGALAISATRVTLSKISSAVSGYNGDSTLVITQDRPDGSEPEQVMALIHDTARENKLNSLKQSD